MAFRINVSCRIKDSLADVYLKNFRQISSAKINELHLIRSYTIDAKLSPPQQKQSLELLANKTTETASTRVIVPAKFTWIVELGFLPGVTDNVGTTAKETLRDGVKAKFKPGQNVYSSQVLLISGHIHENEIRAISNSLYNPLIQRATILSAKEFASKGLPTIVPRVHLKGTHKSRSVDLNISDDELAKLSKLGIPNEHGIPQGPLALDADALKTIRGYFNEQKRKPTDVELECLAQTWSEHCKHLIFASPIDDLQKGLYKTYIKAATEKIRRDKSSPRGSSSGDFCISVFTDNAGGIIFDDEYLITHKVETHNTPSALDPFGGAITGIGGVNRDALGFGLGAKPIANFYGFCLADPKDKTELYRDAAQQNKMLSAARIMQGVVAGINSGGNQSGIPTPNGFIYFDPRYRGKPLVFAGTVGLIPRKINGKPSHQKKAQPGDYIVMLGGRVGKDGIHGATFASETLDTHSPATAVQIGDPITQKKFSDAIVREARDLGLYNSITDNGAGGLSSSVGEMAKECGGCLVQLGKVPVKYPGLKPYEIWISESQERMTLAVPKKKWKQFSRLMKKSDVQTTVIGKFTNSGNCIVKFGKATVMNMSMDFLHNGLVLKQLQTQKPANFLATVEARQLVRHSLGEGGGVPNQNGMPGHAATNLEPITVPSLKTRNLKFEILHLLSSLNITSSEFIAKQYDHEVQGTSVTKPLQGKGRVNAETAVLRPVLTSKKGIVLSSALCPSLSEIDPYHMAAASIDSAIRAAVAAGANVDYLALLDNFCWCSPENPTRLWQLKEAARACYHYAVAFGTPFISGKDSMYNDFKGFGPNGEPIKISIPPTLLISTMGVIPDITKVVTIDTKQSGDLVYILGETSQELAGSEFERMQNVAQARGLHVPTVDAKKNLVLYRAFYQAVQKNLVASAISINRGGLAVALSKMSIAGQLGVMVNSTIVPCNRHCEESRALSGRRGNPNENESAMTTVLFSESPGRLLVTIDPKKQQQFEKSMKGSVLRKIGTVGGKNITIQNSKKAIADISLSDAEKSYKSTLKNF